MVRSTLTDYGNLVSPTAFEKVKDTSVAMKINAYKKTSQKIPIYLERFIDGGMYYQVPRGVCRVGHIRREEHELIDEVTPPSLMEYQEIIVKHVVESLESDSHFYLQMDTGLGKSYVAAGLIASMRTKTCIIVANKSLGDQMYDDIMKAIPDVTVTRYKSPKAVKGSLKKVTVALDESVVIVVINTAAKLGGAFYEQFGLVIFDEVHAYCTDSFGAVFFNADHARYTFGMTATPQRLDGMETISFLHLGQPVPAAEIAKDDEEMAAGNFHGTVVRVEYNGPREFTKTIKNSNGVPSPILMAKQFLEDPFRIILAAMIAIDAYKAGRNIYIFCQMKEPLEILRRRMLKVVPAEYKETLKDELFIITGDSKKEMAAAARSTSRIFLTTYSLSAKGLSIPRFDTLILLTPMKSNMMQITGRIFRKKSDEARRRLIVDIVDVRTFMDKQYTVRRATYKARDLRMVSRGVDYRDIGNEKAMHGLLDCIDAYNVYDDDDAGENTIRVEWPTIPDISEMIYEYASDDEED